MHFAQSKLDEAGAEIGTWTGARGAAHAKLAGETGHAFRGKFLERASIGRLD